MDAILICGSNVLFENFAAFAVFAVVGNLRRWPTDGVRLGAFVVGFYTLPEVVLQMPGSNFWAFLLFFTLIVLGFSSAFVMLDVVATLLVDSGVKYSRPVIVTGLTIVSFLMCLPYCTEFGYYLLDGIDRWINNVALIAVVWGEVAMSTTIYRYSDVIDQVGLSAFATYNVGYFGSQILGVSVAHGLERPEYGAAAGIGFFAVASLVAVFIAQNPSLPAPKPAVNAERRFGTKKGLSWIPTFVTKMSKKDGNNTYRARFWYLAFYSVSSGTCLEVDL